MNALNQIKSISDLCDILQDATAVMVDDTLAFPSIEDGDEIVIDLNGHTITIDENSTIKEVEVSGDIHFIVTIGNEDFIVVPLVPVKK